MHSYFLDLLLPSFNSNLNAEKYRGRDVGMHAYAKNMSKTRKREELTSTLTPKTCPKRGKKRGIGVHAHAKNFTKTREREEI